MNDDNYPKPGTKEWLEAKSKGPKHNYLDAAGVNHTGYMERYCDFGGSDQAAHMRDMLTGELSIVSGSRLKGMTCTR